MSVEKPFVKIMSLNARYAVLGSVKFTVFNALDVKPGFVLNILKINV